MKNLTISKELLSEVFGENVLSFDIGGNEILIEFDKYENILNIYELAHKCKEWAYKQDYDIWSITWGAVEFQNNKKYNGTERVNADTEVEAIFKACDYILNELSNS